MKPIPSDVVAQYREMVTHLEEEFRTHGREFIAYLLAMVREAIDEENKRPEPAPERPARAGGRQNLN